jgi:hypothetical protein
METTERTTHVCCDNTGNIVGIPGCRHRAEEAKEIEPCINGDPQCEGGHCKNEPNERICTVKENICLSEMSLHEMYEHAPWLARKQEEYVFAGCDREYVQESTGSSRSGIANRLKGVMFFSRRGSDDDIAGDTAGL